ncbi:MAG: Na+/H+ antiporter subunit E [Chlorobi bacterium]|nr:Na+/H+ antiporter subunit E [Chlorobiota bacterium]
MIVWVAFTTSFAVAELVTGAIVSMIISLLSIRMFTCCKLSILAPKRIFYMIVYFFVFIIALIKANFDVARRVLTPSLPINPGIVKFKTKLKTDYSKMVLANSITLTPGTLSVDIIDDTFYIHWIDVKTTDPEKAYKDIAWQFEKILLKIF